MKFSRKQALKTSLLLAGAAMAGLATLGAISGPEGNTEAHSPIDAALYRTVTLLGGELAVRRPPAETVPALTELIRQDQSRAELFSLRALEDEQKLDFTAAESDWKLYLQNAGNKTEAKAEAQIALADFYQRRHRPQGELKALSLAAQMPSPPSEKLAPVAQQRSWVAFERIFAVIQAQALGKNLAMEQYNLWLERYPQEPGLYGRYLQYLLERKEWKAAADLIAKYHGRFPEDQVFPTRARALLAYRQGSVEEGLAVYDQGFQPLWPPELVKNYFDLLGETRNLRKFLDQANGALARNPADLSAVARVFYYYQQQGNLQAAQQAITGYRLQKESRKAPWTAQELYTLATLLDAVNLYPEAARYYYALYNSQGMDAGPEKALAGLTHILLAAPEQPIPFGSGDLSMYRDIGAMDTGPGYLNGILSLLLNTTQPGQQYAAEEQRAAPYFHRSRASELLALLDQRFPRSTARPELHAQLIKAYAGYGEDQAVIRTGGEFLAAFPGVEQRHAVALLMADAHARLGHTAQEFAIYDSMLQELGRKAEGVPLGPSATGFQAPGPEEKGREGEGEAEGEGKNEDQAAAKPRKSAPSAAFAVATTASAAPQGVYSPEYEQILTRYISRLVQQKKVLAALAVWRQELDRNPNDPGLYARFAGFLGQNGLTTEAESVYKRAIQQFPDKNWYNRLARWYLSLKRHNELQALSDQVLKIFSGSELEAYLGNTSDMPRQLYLDFNQYAHNRFPHDLAFVRNLLGLYELRQFRNDAAWYALMREHWLEDEGLRNRFFEYLSRTGKLETELQALKDATPQADWEAQSRSNPAAARFVAEAETWRSHFEQSAPVMAAVARQYPADFETGRRASSLYRSLAYFDPQATEAAIQLESNLLQYAPASRETLARIGDIYSDRELFTEAAPYWERMAATEPGNPGSYEEAATVFWDYYFFDDALRLLHQGRASLGDDTLYSYQAGAVYENQRDYPHAVEEYVKGALRAGDTSCQSRLLQLARRPSTRDLVEAATSKAVADMPANLEAIHLRVAVLEAQFTEGKPDAKAGKQAVAAFLDGALERNNSVEVLEAIEALATEKSMEAVRQHALERQAAVSQDPVRRLELRYALVRFYEQKKDLASAQTNVDALYRENPKILGVVRSTVDFCWRNKLQQRAIDVLRQAAQDAYPVLRVQFNYEAARKMTDAGQYEGARGLLAALLGESPYKDEYLAAMADTFARAGDHAGLRDFYLERIKLLQKSTLAAADRKERLAGLRRGLVPALTALQDYAGAVDQYIELLNAYPEDAGLASEAAFYAQRHQRQEQLLNFYAKTVAASPKDSRWAVVLARVQTNYEDFEGTIKTYSQAIAIRPDRADLLTARAALAERLMRLDQASADYASLYDLTYHDPQWMEKAAEIRARQGKPELAVQALKTAFLDGRPETAAKYFAVAQRLETWGMMSQALGFAEQGVAVAGGELLASQENHAGAQQYARLMTRLRRQEEVYKKLWAALAAANQLPSLPQQIAKKGADAVTDQEWRASLLHTRQENAHNGMMACMKEMGSAAALYFTPEEKLALAHFLEAQAAVSSRKDVYDYLLSAAASAGIPELEAKWIDEELLAGTAIKPANRLEDLQVRRLKLMELAQQLERLSAAKRPGWGYLNEAAEIYALAGRAVDELRVREALYASPLATIVDPLTNMNRYLELLLAANPQRIAQLAGAKNERGDLAANFTLAHGDPALANAAIQARRSEPPVWRSAYIGLAGLYFADPAPPVQAAFLAALADKTIGERLAQPLDRDQALAGDVWFYYASRYGEYLGVTRKGDPEDFLPAELEHTPGRAGAYFTTALGYEGVGDAARAIADYGHVLELDARRVDVHNRLAGIYWKLKRAEDATGEWKMALEILKTQAIQGPMPSTFWGDYAATVSNLASRQLLPRFQPDLNEILHAYVKRNGTYRVAPLLRGTLASSKDPGAATALIVELSEDAANKLEFLRPWAAPKPGLPLQPEPLYRRVLELIQDQVRTSEGVAREYAQSDLENWQLQWIEYLFQAHQYDRANAELDALPQTAWQNRQAALVPLRLQLAAHLNTFDKLLESYRADLEHAPASPVLRQAVSLLQAGDRPSARKILELVFSREIENHNLTASNMLGLADIRLQDGDLAGGVALLRRMTLVVGAPFETQDAAAALLMKTGHPAEAAGFLQELVTATPWNPDFRVRLAQARLAAHGDTEAARKDLASVASNKDAPYETRISAARSWSSAGFPMDAAAGGVAWDSQELKLLAGKSVSASDASQPFFFAARLKAAEGLAPAAQIALLRAALEDRPSGDAARLPLLRAAMSGGDYYLAVAAMQPFLDNRAALSASASQKQPAEDAGDQEILDTEPDVGSDAAEFDVMDVGRLPAKEKAEITRDLGVAYRKTGSLDKALAYFRQAWRLETRPAEKTQINKDVQQIRAELRRDASNRARQPVIHDALEQDRAVHPRLVAQGVRKGGGQ